MARAMKRPSIPDDLRRHIGSFLTREGIESVPISQETRDYWATGVGDERHLQPVSLTLSATQWVAVIAMIRLAAGIGTDPELAALAHRELRDQLLRAAPHLYRDDPDGTP